MNIQENLHCLNNLKHIKQMHEAGIDHAVIAHFLQSENIPIEAEQIDSILKSIDPLCKSPIPASKLTAIMSTKAELLEIEQIPCPV